MYMVYKVTALLVISCYPALICAQILYKSQIIHNGFEGGKLVRNHTVLYYHHLNMKLAGGRKLTDGFITVDHVVEYAMNDNFTDYANYIYRDTLVTFYGITMKGKKNGTFLSLPPGNIFYLHTYRNDVENGEYKGFYSTGQLFCEGYYENGKQVGNYKQYYANGKLALIHKVIADVASLSHLVYYYTNGQIESKGSYYNEKKVNEWYYYDRQGNLVKTEYYTNKGRLVRIK